jgi:hypothetical protein
LSDAEREALNPGAGSAAATDSLSTVASRIGDLLANPATKAVLDKHFPGMSEDKQIAMASGMTLRAVQAFAPAQFTDETLDALDAEFAALPVA